ncbi:MAG: tungstate ABC transporter substrate-binding protein WtpA [Planctomycetes bacterium]|nr:tungstate ABC transporter substrate-binding protein WtpA [Planctomycetota bacterium]
MKKNTWYLIVCIIISLALLGGAMGCKKRDENSTENELIIFHAGSLSVPFREISTEFKKQHPNISIKAEASGSRACARKISDLGRDCDILASADYKVVTNLLMPNHTDFNICFALNEMVIAYTDKSRLNSNITPDNWHDIILRDEVSFGRSDPNLDPCGYRSLMVFQLAQKYYEVPGLAEKLQEKDEYIRPKETDLLALLETGEIDYLFIYRSVATQHGLNIILLPDEINLKFPAFTKFYNTATVKLSGKKPSQFITRKGEPMVYSITIPKSARNPKAAEAWIALLLSEKGVEIMERNGQPCIKPAEVDVFDKLPDAIKSFCR